MIDTSNWKWFRYDEIFEIKKGKRLTKEDMEEGNIPYIGATDSNNGITAYISNNRYIHDGNTISLSYNGSIGNAFYQPVPFWATDDVNVLYPRFSLNKYIAMFIISLLEKEKFRFCYGRKWHMDIMKSSTIKLPVNEDMKPNWQHIELFIKDVIIPNLPCRAKSVWDGTFEKSPIKNITLELDVDSWHWFRYDEVFDIKHGFYNKKPDDNPQGDIPFIGATDSNNGVTSHSDLDTIENTTKTGDGKNAPLSEKIFENCIAVTNNGSVGYAYYQEKPFTCTHDVNPLYIKKEYGIEMNKYIAMFLCTLIEKERFRWAYGRKWRPKRMPSSLIKLPAIPNADGTYIPDWQFMEDYIKSLPYSKNI